MRFREVKEVNEVKEVREKTPYEMAVSSLNRKLDAIIFASHDISQLQSKKER